MTTVFSPDDLTVVKDGPSLRRAFLDDVLKDFDQRAAELQRDFERVLKQRNALLRQAAGRLTQDVASTLDVWDAKMALVGEALGFARYNLVELLSPLIAECYNSLAAVEKRARIGASMITDWRAEDGGKGLEQALAASRQNDVARGITSIGPHRDELHLTINGLPARSHASQGEQRTLALGMRLATHIFLQDKIGVAPILLMDDVFSELDAQRSDALLQQLPKSQTFITTSTALPLGVQPEATIRVDKGVIIQ